MAMNLAQKIQLQTKYKITGVMTFRTAFRIGSGKEGESGSDLGVLLAPDGRPILPGSTLKGKFRSTAEKLAYLLKMSACMLDYETSQVRCVSDIAYFRKQNEDNDLADMTAVERYKWAIKQGQQQICDVCMLFGSPLMASRIFFHDGELDNWPEVVERRDGVVIDRDSERAVENLKYDFEVVPAGTSYKLRIDLENPTSIELALVAIVLAEWQEGIKVGGGVSRGLGLAVLASLKIEKVDFTKTRDMLDYLIDRRMQEVTKADWDKNRIEVVKERNANQQEGAPC